MTDWIQGEKFWGLADMVYSPDNECDDYNKRPNTLDIDRLEDYDIIYTHTMYVKKLFDFIERVDKKLIIITHNSDINVDSSFMMPDNIIKWYSTNVNVINPRIESIPIGLENNRWFVDVHKKEKMFNKTREVHNLRNWVYMNHSITTNPSKRTKPFEIFKDKSWVTTEMRNNGVDFDNYIENLYNHKYVICPEGNGMDTHRTWECLYLETIPIEKRNINNMFYTDLPILFVDDWEEITEDFLYKQWWRIKQESWNWDKLDFGYWRNKIRHAE